MSRVCLDTTVLSEAIRERPDALAAIAQLERRGDTAVTTAHNVFEAAVGALRLKSPDGQLATFARLRRILEGIEVIPFDVEAAIEAAQISVALSKGGRPPPTMDLLTASTARRSGCRSVVTRNAGDFKRLGVLDVIGY